MRSGSFCLAPSQLRDAVALLAFLATGGSLFAEKWNSSLSECPGSCLEAEHVRASLIAGL